MEFPCIFVQSLLLRKFCAYDTIAWGIVEYFSLSVDTFLMCHKKVQFIFVCIYFSDCCILYIGISVDLPRRSGLILNSLVFLTKYPFPNLLL